MLVGNNHEAGGLRYPGAHLVEILEELHISQDHLAQTMGVDPRRLNQIIHHRAPITADTAQRIGAALGTTPAFWLSLQRMYDLDCARTVTDTAASKSLAEAST